MCSVCGQKSLSRESVWFLFGCIMASFQLLGDFSWTRWEPLLGSCPSRFHTRSDPHHRHIYWHRENFVSVTGARPIVLKLALCLWLQHYFCTEKKAVYNPTALTLVPSSIAIKLMQKCLTSISGDCEQFLAGQCWRWFQTRMLDKRESAAAILWFCKSTKGDNLACLGCHPEGFYITQLSTAASAFFGFLLQICENVFTGKCLLR